MKVFPFDSLYCADLVVDAVYEGGTRGNAGDDPISKLLQGVGNMGGFRRRIDSCTGKDTYCVLYSSNVDPDWPDEINLTTGLFTYYGDNKKPGAQIEETQRGGNRFLRFAFEKAHGNQFDRQQVPPIFLFTKATKGRDVIFRGLAVPGSKSISQNEDLVAVWKVRKGQRFQNYKALFTILNISVISRGWLRDLENSSLLTVNCPVFYRLWVERRIYTPLIASQTTNYRTKTEQLPPNEASKKLINVLYTFFKDDPYRFEKCAADIVHMMDRNVLDIVSTPRSADGGRDGIGLYQIGPEVDPIQFDFALEAKCYALDNPIGVKGLSRLISRLRNRQFGILVTTSYLSEQAYKELRQDGHPVIVLSSGDITKIFARTGLGNEEDLTLWLTQNYLK